MASIRSAVAFGLAVLGSLTSGAAAQNQYALDDGVPNSGLSYGLPGDFGWMQSFQTVGPTDAISKVSIMWPQGAFPAGKTVHVCVWEDPTDSADPYASFLVAQVAGTVGSTATLAYRDYPLLNPVVVQGKFFIGAYITTNGTAPSIALLDHNSGLSGRAWFATAGAGGFDAAQPGNNSPSHIEVLGAGIHGVFMLRAEGTGTVPTVYCTAKTNSLGCEPQIGYFGTPSAGSGGGFFLTAWNERNRKSGMLLYGTAGRATTPFFGGTLCIAQPVRRTTAQNSGGTAQGDDCTGVYALDFGAWIGAAFDPALVAGAIVNAQYYARDPGFTEPNNVALTRGIEFVLGQ